MIIQLIWTQNGHKIIDFYYNFLKITLFFRFFFRPTIFIYDSNLAPYRSLKNDSYYLGETHKLQG